MSTPAHVPPQYRFVSGCRSPDCSRIESIVKKHDRRCSPISSNWNGTCPPPRTLHFVGCEVEGIEFRFCQVVPSGNVVVWYGLWKARRHVDKVVLPRPGNYSTKVCPSLVGSPTRASAAVRYCKVINPAQKISNRWTVKPFNWDSSLPALPLGDGGLIFASGALRNVSCLQRKRSTNCIGRFRATQPDWGSRLVG